MTLRGSKLTPDFAFKLYGDVPLPDDNLPLVDVLFHDASPKVLTNQGKLQWDFGDGQTADERNPEHVYLRPGLYTVKLSIRHEGRTYEIANRIEIDQPALDYKDKLHTLDDHLALLETYNPRTLDAVSLRQLILAYETKAADLYSSAEKAQKEIDEGPTDPNRKPYEGNGLDRQKKNVESMRTMALRYLSQAVKTGEAAFAEQSAAKSDEDLAAIAAPDLPYRAISTGRFATGPRNMAIGGPAHR